MANASQRRRQDGFRVVTKYLEDEAGRGIKESTLKSFRKFLCGSPKRNPNGNYSPTLVEFAKKQEPELVYLRDFTPDYVTQFRAAWKLSRHAFTVQSERLRQFFRYAHDNRWIPENPAAKMKAPNVTKRPVTAFTKISVR